MSLFRRISEKKKGKPETAKKSQHVTHTEFIKPDNINGKAGAVSSRTHQSNDLLLLQDDFYPGDLGVSLQSQEEYAQKSCLSKTFTEVLHDHEAVTYLIQYMESCKAVALIRFWLDAESFQASTWTRIRSHSLQSVSKSSLVRDKSDLSTDSVIRSYHKDITSPVSADSVDCDDGSTKSVSTEALDRVENVNQDECKPLDNRDVAEPVSAEKQNQSTTTADRDRSIPNEGMITAELKDSDSRVREKCKLKETKANMELALNPTVDCDNDSVDRPNDPDSSRAISYRDITSPSPTGQDGSTTLSSQGPVSSVTRSNSNLAEKLKKSVEQDAVRIFTKYLAQEATHPIAISDDLRNNTIRKICREDGQVDPECFVECQKFAVERMEKEYFDGFKSSVYHCKYQVEVLTSGKLHISDIVYNDSALFYFMEYLEQEGLSHLLHFVIAADNFERMLSQQETYDGLQAQDDAMVLYDKYFSLQAASPLGFPDDVRFEIEGNICREEGPLPDCFAKPRQIVLHTLQRRHLQHYLTSDIYCKFLSELVSTVQTAQDFPLGQRKRRGSESSSEHSVGAHSTGAQSIGSESISSKNTLLASGTSRRVKLDKLDENMKNMTMDPGMLNPDKLWERTTPGMRLGQVDSLGQFVSSFDPDPEATTTFRKKSSGSKFFKSKKDKEREQEEMARKVAEMILKDVTSVTQAVGAIKGSKS